MSAALLAAGLLAAGCSRGPEPPSVAHSDASDRAETVRAVLEDAGTAAQRFGRAHLGHFRNMDPQELQREGLDVPSDISIAVKTDHTTYCIRAKSSVLPSIHPWAKATLKSRGEGPSANDGCFL